MVAGKRLKNIVKPCRIAYRDNMSLGCPVQGVSGPIAHHAACAGNDWDQGGKVMQLQSGLDNDVDMAARQ